MANSTFFYWDIEVQFSLFDFFYNTENNYLDSFFIIPFNILLKELLIYISFIIILFLFFLIYINI